MKVILIAAISVNGKIAQDTNQSSLEWTSKEDTAFFVEKTKEVGVVVMGQKTFETIGRPLKGRRLIVLTQDESLQEKYPEVDDGKTRLEFVNESPTDLIQRLEFEGVKAIVIGGGGFVYTSFLRAGLVKEIYLTVEPILFGNGIALAEGFHDIKLSLVETRLLGEQSVLLHYRVI